MCRKHYERWRVHGDPNTVLLQMPESRGEPRHGTSSCYNGGCRCDNCREANHAYLRKYRSTNKERISQATKRWRSANPDAVKLSGWAAEQRQAGLPPTDETIAYAGILFADPCSYCGASAGAIDHIVPRLRGGDGEWTNLTAACGSCNSRKHAKPLLRFLLERVS
jgi:5-methylcytosine-specific restriction endonuclease McrA